MPATIKCSHRGALVPVGVYEVMAGGSMYLQPQDFFAAEVIVPLTGKLMQPLGPGQVCIPLPLPDFGGVPDDWREQLVEKIIPQLQAGKPVLVYCFASHGRTGTFLGSLIALLESDEQTPDPIAAVRSRHCREAVETMDQAKAIFALRGQPLPERYRIEFTPKSRQESLGQHSGGQP